MRFFIIIVLRSKYQPMMLFRFHNHLRLICIAIGTATGYGVDREHKFSAFFQESLHLRQNILT